MGQRCSAGSMARSVSMGGGAGPGLVSVLNPCAPPRVVSAVQYDGATYSYGPVILTPVSPAGVFLAVAEDWYGFGHSTSLMMSRYSCSIFGGGGLSLPYSQSNTAGCRASRRNWSRSEAAAMASSSASHCGHFSQ